MGKFADRDDTGYKRIVGEIERWLDKLEIIAGEKLCPNLEDLSEI